MASDPPADESATAEFMRAMKENLCIYTARFVQLVLLINGFFVLGLCVTPRLLVSLLPVCMRFLECSPFICSGIIAYIYLLYKCRSGTYRWRSLTRILLLLLLCSSIISLSINFGKKGLDQDLEMVLGPKFPNDKTCALKWQDNYPDNMCTLQWLDNDPTPFGSGADRVRGRLAHDKVRALPEPLPASAR